MNPFLMSKEDRLKVWREFRLKSLDKDMTDYEQLEMVVEWWSQAPIVNRLLDPYDCSQWPTGWELMHEGDVCKSSRALGMEQSLLLREGRWTEDRLKLLLINDDEDVYLVLSVDNRWLLNYRHNHIFDYTAAKNVNILETYVFQDNAHKIQYSI